MLWELSYSTSRIWYVRLVGHFIGGARIHTNLGNVFTEKPEGKEQHAKSPQCGTSGKRREVQYESMSVISRDVPILFPIIYILPS